MKTLLIHLLQNAGENPGSKFNNGGEGNVSVSDGENAECVRRIAASIEHMLQNLDQPLSVSRLAAAANISPSHFFTLFRRCTGGAPIDFFIRLRMERACHLLETTRLNVREIGARLGYDDPFYFSRAFKAVHHLSPNKYRQKIIASNGVNRENLAQPLTANQLLPRMVISKIDGLDICDKSFGKDLLKT